MDCPNKKMGSEIMGANFKVDAVVANPNLYKAKDIDLAAAQTAVVMKFKKEATPENVYDVGTPIAILLLTSQSLLQNRIQLVSAANHIMNDDIRRNWMYGVCPLSSSRFILG
jgi:hypothetical protein